MVWWDATVAFFGWLGLKKETTIPFILFGFIAYLIWTKKLTKILMPFRHAIVEIQTIFREGGKSIAYPLTEKTESPLSPSDYGLKLFEESGLKGVLKQNEGVYTKRLDKKLSALKVVTAYDVQEKAIELFTKEVINEEELAIVKTYAFRSGLDIVAILRIGALILRDKYLKKHPEIT